MLVDLGLACVSAYLSVEKLRAEMIVGLFSAWAQSPPHITVNVCTLRRQGKTHMADYGVQPNSARSLSGRSRRTRECVADGLLIGWVT